MRTKVGDSAVQPSGAAAPPGKADGEPCSSKVRVANEGLDRPRRRPPEFCGNRAVDAVDSPLS